MCRPRQNAIGLNTLQILRQQPQPLVWTRPRSQLALISRANSIWKEVHILIKLAVPLWELPRALSEPTKQPSERRVPEMLSWSAKKKYQNISALVKRNKPFPRRTKNRYTASSPTRTSSSQMPSKTFSLPRNYPLLKSRTCLRRRPTAKCPNMSLRSKWKLRMSTTSFAKCRSRSKMKETVNAKSCLMKSDRNSSLPSRRSGRCSCATTRRKATTASSIPSVRCHARKF